MSFIAWPNIEAFHTVRKCLLKYPELLKGREKVTYQGKVKLHGTNAGIFCKAGRFTAQSRATVITSGNDNMGFAAWVESEPVQSALASAYRNMPCDMLIYGEWCGKSIQKGVALNELDQKYFVVFAASLIGNNNEPKDELIVEPNELEEYVKGVPNCKVIPWHNIEPVQVQWLEESSHLTPVVDVINADVLAVEKEDPWVKKEFGISGIGEGIVYYPVSHCGRENFANLAFKAKGEKHSVLVHNKPAQESATVVAGVVEFVGLVLSPARLEQGARAVNKGEFKCEPRLTGPFLAWIAGDIQKECGPELEASNLTWKHVQKNVGETARMWYITKSKEL